MAASITDDPWSTRLAAASAASDAGDWGRALALWEGLRAERPGDSLCWLKTGEAYCQAGLPTRADAILRQATERFPDDLWIAFQYTIVAQRTADWPEALFRAEEIRRSFPGHAIGHVLSGEALRELGRLDEAEAAFAAAVGRFPDDEWALYHWAGLATRRQQWDAALRRWQTMLAAFPQHRRAALAGCDEALRMLGRADEAEAVAADIRQAIADEVQRQGIAAVLPARVANPVVLIEITSICNFACGYCVSPMKLREKQQMSLDTFRRVIEQVATITTNPIRLHIDGEPTSHPHFKEMALLVNRHGLPVWLATNGSRLDASFLDIWMDPLISMSTSRDELAKRHSKLDFDRYVDRIADYTAAWARSRARQNLNFQILYYRQETAEAEAAYRQGKNAFLVEFCHRAGLYDACVEATSVDEEVYCLRRSLHPGEVSFLKQPVSTGGLYPVDGKMVGRQRATAGFCDSPWRQLVIHSNGTLGACCVDLSGGTSFATAEEMATMPLKELWESGPQIAAMRDNFLHGRVERDVCQRCLTHGQVAFVPNYR